MKITFLYPNLSSEGCINAGIAILSSVLKREGHEISLFDTTFFEKKSGYMNLDREKFSEFKRADRSAFNVQQADIRSEFKKHVQSNKPDLLCVSCISGQFNFAVELLESLGEHRPYTLIGGKYPTVCPEKAMSNSYIDALCLGEGEGPIVNFTRCFEKGESVSSLENFWVKENGTVVKNPIGMLKDEMDSIPYYDIGLFDERHLLQPFDGKLRRTIDIEVSRGCPYGCAYCINPVMKKIFKGKGKFYRKKGVDALINELEYYKNKFNIELVKINDDCFLAMDEEYMSRFVSEYSARIALPFIACTRPETVRNDRINALKKIKAPFQISVGIESGDEDLRKKVLNRKMSQERIVEAFRILKNNNIRTCAFVMMGFPYETRGQVFETIRLTRSVNSDIVVASVFYPFEGVPLRDTCVKEGYLEENIVGASNLVKECIINMPQLTKIEIDSLRKTFMLYVRTPEIIWPLIHIAEKETTLSRFIYFLLHKYCDFIFNRTKRLIPLFFD